MNTLLIRIQLWKMMNKARLQCFIADLRHMDDTSAATVLLALGLLSFYTLNLAR